VFIRIPCQSIRLSTIQDFHVSLLHHKPLLRASYLPRQSGFPRCTLWLTPANGTYDNILRHVLENVRPPFQRDWRPRICDCRQSHYNFTFDFRRDTMFPASTLGLSRTLLKPTAFHRPASTRPLPVVPPPQLQMQLLEKRRLDATASRLGPPWSSWSADQSPVS
jgi:hypothetical protein